MNQAPPAGGYCGSCRTRYYGTRGAHDGPLDTCAEQIGGAKCGGRHDDHDARTGHDYLPGGH